MSAGPTDANAAISYGTRLAQLVGERGDATAVTLVSEDGSERSVGWQELDRRSNQLARVFASRGLGIGEPVAICLKNSVEHLLAGFAGWKVGAVVVPIRWDLPDWERDRLMAVLRPALVVGTDVRSLFEESAGESSDPLPDAVSPRGWGVCSSGSTGTPKVIVQKAPALYRPSTAFTSAVVASYGPMQPDQRVLCPAPIYHTNGFTAFRVLLHGDPIVLMERFKAELALDIIERHRITGFIAATPMLQRMAQVPDIDDRDLSSLSWVHQGAAPLPRWLGQRWIDLVGAEHFYMSYGSSEQIGIVVCRGDEWLAHPGTLGRGMGETEVRIVGSDGDALPPGEVGSIFLRSPTGPLAMYVGDDVAPMEETADGFHSVGDLGWMDEDGYLYMVDRRVDMIVTGAANVYPAEVEAALSEHPGIADVVIIGLRDPEWGKRVHAIVQPAEPSLEPASVIAYAKDRLAPYKAPKSVEFVESIPRTEATKFNRAALVAERESPEDGESRPVERGPSSRPARCGPGSADVTTVVGPIGEHPERE
jgi:bile acid-coenzyme A ligase